MSKISVCLIFTLLLVSQAFSSDMSLSDVAKKELNLKHLQDKEIRKISTISVKDLKLDKDETKNLFVSFSAGTVGLKGESQYENKVLNLSDLKPFTFYKVEFSKTSKLKVVDRFNLGLGFGGSQEKFKNPIGGEDKANINLFKLHFGPSWELANFQDWKLFGKLMFSQFFYNQVSETSLADDNISDSMFEFELAVQSRPIWKEGPRLFANYSILTDINYGGLDEPQSNLNVGFEAGWK